jgi:hypothetical protein
MKSTRTLRVAFWLAVAGMAFFAMAASSPQCARTSESPLTPSLSAQSGGNGTCSQLCIDDFQIAKKLEQVRFKEAMDACNGDQACKDQETAVHDAINNELVADKDACIANCSHTQGGATGGQ